MGAKADTACSTQTDESHEAPPTRGIGTLHPHSCSGTLYFPGFLSAQTRAPWPPMEWPLMDILPGSVGKLASMTLGSWETHTGQRGVRGEQVTQVQRTSSVM